MQKGLLAPFLVFFLLGLTSVLSCIGCPHIVNDLSSPNVQAALKFAVRELSTTSTVDQIRILSAASQVVNGVNYHLTFEVVEGQNLDIFQAVVYFNTTAEDHRLLSYDALMSRRASGASCMGCIMDVDPTREDVKYAALAAWKEASTLDNGLNPSHGENFKVLAAGVQLVNGLNFFMLLQGDFEDFRVIHTATVYRSFSNEYKVLRSTTFKAVL